MRRLALLIAGGALWLFLLAVPALADGGPHVKGSFGATPSACASCHRAHSAVAPDLLQQPVANICKSCHGTGATGSVLDVIDGASFASGVAHLAGNDPSYSANAVGALRGGGFEYALIDTANSTAGSRLATIGVRTPPAAAASTSSHSVDGSAVTMWGAGANSTTSTGGKADVDMTCGSCHDPHGNGQYRILRPTPEDTAGVAGSNIVQINDVASKVYTTTNYGQLGTFNSVDSQALNPVIAGQTMGSSLQYDTATKTWRGTFAEASSRWCTTCHTRYMGFSGSAGAAFTTPDGTGDAVYKFKHATRTTVDPGNVGAPITGILSPINTGSGVDPAAVIGCYTDSRGFIYQGVAVLLGTSSTGATDCTGPSTSATGVAPNYNVSGLLSGTAGTITGKTLTTGAPRCIACHVSHGSPAVMASTITDQTSPGINQGGTPHLDSTLLRLDQRGVCVNCHAK